MFTGVMTHAWIVATLAAIVCGLVGFFVVARKAAFAAHVLPLSAFPGAAVATLLGIDPFIGIVSFAALGVLGISQLERHERREVATALWLAAALALGTLFLSLTRQYSQGVYALLFGEVLGVSARELAPFAVLDAVAIGAVLLLFRPLLLDSVSPDLAAAAGARPGRMELVFLALLALSTATALPVVGALLVFSLMVGPASAARFLADRPLPALALSVLISLATVWGAIALAYASNWPVGFFVGALSAACYVLGRLCHGLQRPLRTRHVEVTP